MQPAFHLKNLDAFFSYLRVSCSAVVFVKGSAWSEKSSKPPIYDEAEWGVTRGGGSGASVSSSLASGCHDCILNIMLVCDLGQFFIWVFRFEPAFNIPPYWARVLFCICPYALAFGLWPWLTVWIIWTLCRSYRNRVCWMCCAVCVVYIVRFSVRWSSVTSVGWST